MRREQFDWAADGGKSQRDEERDEGCIADEKAVERSEAIGHNEGERKGILLRC